MAKKIVKSTTSREDLKNAPAAYFKSLTLQNIKCFKGKQTIDLSDGNGKPAHWTVILGNNNTGKTTILKALVGLSAVDITKNKSDSTHVMPLYLTYQLLNLDKSLVKSEVFIIDKLNGKINGSLNNAFSILDGWKWEYGGLSQIAPISKLGNLIEFAYGTHRKIANGITVDLNDYDDDIVEQYNKNFLKNADLENPEEWILQLSLSEKLGHAKAADILSQIHNILTSGLLPDVNGFEIKSEGGGAIFFNFVLTQLF